MHLIYDYSILLYKKKNDFNFNPFRSDWLKFDL